ncbi:MAG: hypothetical protein V1752_06820 [Candidatus Firestonebacteria bacterium]
MHKNIEKLILKSFENKLTQQEQSELNDHLLVCASCKALFEGYKRDDLLMGRIFKNKKLPPEFIENLKKEISSGIQRKTIINDNKSIFGMPIVVPIGLAAIFLIAFAGIFTYNYFFPTKQPSVNRQQTPMNLNNTNTSDTQISEMPEITAEPLKEKLTAELPKENKTAENPGSCTETLLVAAGKTWQTAKTVENVDTASVKQGSGTRFDYNASKEIRLDKIKGVKMKYEGFVKENSRYVLSKSESGAKNYYFEIIFPKKAEINRIVVDTGYWNYKGETYSGMYNCQIVYDNFKFGNWRVLKTYNKNKLLHLEIKEKCSTDKIKIEFRPALVIEERCSVTNNITTTNVYLGNISNFEVYGCEITK